MARAHQHDAPRPHEAWPDDRRPQERTPLPDVGHDHAEMLRRWIWRDFANILLGAWLIASPATLGYRDPAMIVSDLTAGILIVVLGAFTLSPRFDLARWGLCFSGIWLLFAPLVFWMAFVGFFLSRYLAAYQLGHIPYPWDPFFGDGTRRVLDSGSPRRGRSLMPDLAPCPTCSRRSRA